MEIGFIHMPILVHLHVNKPYFHIKFHFWDLSGYSDLSVEEGIVGSGEGIV